MVKALVAFGYEAFALHEAEFSTRDRMTRLGKPPLRIDIMTSVNGLEFREAWESRVRVTIEGMPLWVAMRSSRTRPRQRVPRTSLTSLYSRR